MLILRPGGVLRASRGRASTGSAVAELHDRFSRAAGLDDAMATGLDGLDGLDEYLERRGAHITRLPPVPNPAVRSVAKFLTDLADGLFSWTWPAAPDRRRAAADEVRRWFAASRGDPASTELPSAPVRWRRYRMPG